jgi:multiple sugar transport system ATP-binding protein
MTLANRVGVMRDGWLVQIGSPREIYENPMNIYVATRLGSPGINLLPRQLIPDMPAPPQAATIGARTEHVRIRKASRAQEAGIGTGTVTWVEHLGDQDHLHIRLGDHDFVTLSDPDQGLTPGDQVAIGFIDPLFFDREGARLWT